MILLKTECKKLKEEISLLESELALLPDFHDFSITDIPFYELKKRRKYKNDYHKYLALDKKVRELRKRLNEISKDLLPDEFKELVKKGKIILTEEDKIILDNLSKFSSLSELCLVHKCDFMPFNNEIKSALASAGESSRSFKIGNISYDYQHQEQRDTIHFSVNGEVGSHDMGNWDVRRYAVIVPFDFYLDKLVSAKSCDSFVKGRALLNGECYILCPVEDADKVRTSNNLVNVIPFEGTNVSGFADAVVSFLGYRHEKIGNHGWLSNDQHLYEALMAHEKLSMSAHINTKDYEYDLMMNSYKHVLEVYSRLLMPDIQIDATILECMQEDSFADNVYNYLHLHISDVISAATSCYFDNHTFNRDKAICILINLLNDLKSINPSFSFVSDFEKLKSKYFVNYHDSIEPFIRDVLNAMFMSVLNRPKEEHLNSEENIKSL